MKRALRTAILVLAIVIGCEVYWLWFGVAFASTETTPFLGRPYYGPAQSMTARFDHEYPLYASEGNNGTIPSTLVRYDGQVMQNAYLDTCPAASCYSGHDAHDFALAYKPVVSAAAGIVVLAGWHNANDHEFGLGLRIQVDHQNNHRTEYGHLSAIRYQPTTSVGRWQIGTSGNTGHSDWPHLHFRVIYNLAGGWQPKDPYGWSGGFPDPWQVNYYGVVSEWLWLDEPARTIPEPVLQEPSYPLDDGDQGTSYNCLYGYHWWTQPGVGEQNDLHYTYANGQSVNCVASWGGTNPPPASIILPSTGLYEVEVHIPYWSGSNPTHAARYSIYFPGGSNTVVVDQHEIPTGGKWISLGRYTFNQGTLQTQFVAVDDRTFIGSFTDYSPRKVLVDALHLHRAH